MDSSYFKKLNAFFGDLGSVNSFLNTSSTIVNLLKKHSFRQLMQEAQFVIQDCKTKNGKDENAALHYLALARKLPGGGKEHCKERKHFYKQALLNMSLDTKQDQLNASYIYFEMAKLFVRLSGKYLPESLASVNQAIELAGDNKQTDYCLKLAKLKIELQIKLKQYNEGGQTLQKVRESMTDSLRLHQNDALNQVNQYEKDLLTEPLEILTPESPTDALLELDENCYIDSNAKKGRHMRIYGPIPNGTYLAKDRVLSVVFEPQFVKSRCSFCHFAIRHIFYPCRHCTLVVFCSAKCEHMSMQCGAHRVDCGLATVFTGLQPSSLAWHAFKLVALFGLKRAVQFYRNNSKQISYTVQEHLKERRLNPEPFERLDKQSQWRAFALCNSFVDHRKDTKTVDAELLCWALTVVLLINQEQHYFSPDNMETNCSLLNDFSLLVEGLAILMRKLRFNVFGWTEIDPKNMNTNYLIGNCVCLVGSMLAHSCNPNLYWEIENGVLILSTASFLANEEITISYGPHQFMDFRKRQRRLADYHFVCACSICLGDAQKLFSLSCSNCFGPITICQISSKELPKCLLCNRPYENYKSVIKSVIQARLTLLFRCRFKGLPQKIAEKKQSIHRDTKKLVDQLSESMHLQCLPLQQAICAAADFLAQKGMLVESFYLTANYISKINLTQLWQNEDALKGIVFLRKCLRMETLIKDWKTMDRRQCSVCEKIQSTLPQLWKHYQKTSKFNKSLNLVTELLEISSSLSQESEK